MNREEKTRKHRSGWYVRAARKERVSTTQDDKRLTWAAITWDSPSEHCKKIIITKTTTITNNDDGSNNGYISQYSISIWQQHAVCDTLGPCPVACDKRFPDAGNSRKRRIRGVLAGMPGCVVAPSN